MERIIEFAKISEFTALSVATLFIIIHLTMKAFPCVPLIYTHQPTEGTIRSIMVHQKAFATPKIIIYHQPESHAHRVPRVERKAKHCTVTERRLIPVQTPLLL